MENGNEQKLIESVKYVVGKYGVSGASTRLIAQEAGVNDALIYYYFKDRETLLARAYEFESGALLACVRNKIRSLRGTGTSIPMVIKSRLVVHALWRYLLDHPEMCRFCSYYYHSPAFTKCSRLYHQSELQALQEELARYFPSPEVAEKAFYSAYNLLYEFSMMVLNGNLPDTEETEQQVFNNLYPVLYSQMVSPHGSQ